MAMAPPVPKTPTPEMALVVLRNGRRLHSSRSKDNDQIHLFRDISLRRENTIGRLEIVAAMHKACGCSSTSPMSTKEKCSDCSDTTDWALVALSRQLLRFTQNKKGAHVTVLIQGRGTHASIRVGESVVETTDDDWSDPFSLSVGNKIQLAPTKLGEHSQVTIELEVALVIDKIEDAPSIEQSSVIDHVPPSKTSYMAMPLNKTKKDKGNVPSAMLEREKDVTIGGRSSLTNVAGTSPLSKSIRSASSIQAANFDHSAAAPYAKTEILRNSRISIFLVPLGQDMPSARRRILARKAEKLGIQEVVDNIFGATHLVISPQVASFSEVSRSLHLPEQQIQKHIEDNGVHCVLPKWIAAAQGAPNFQPKVIEMWHEAMKVRKRKRANTNPAGHRRYRYNMELAEVFRTMSNLHQSCPLLEHDAWKAYMFRIISGRLMNLDFEISNDPETLRRLGGIPAIGKNSLEKIKEYMTTGTISRIEAFRTDPKRVAMKNMMNIWGVGRSKALELVDRGFTNISEVRKAIQDGGRYLDRNQLVGVDCYEDILDEMERDEVEEIGRLVDDAVQQAFEGAEVRIMGSYRRLKPTCGDVDVHITHRSYVKENPELGLSKIVNLLWEQGHMVYHLTFLPGMRTGEAIADYMKSSMCIPRDAWESSKSVGYMSSRGHKCSSYMGVFSSPKHPGKRRRIDIKFYPYRERIFASLYFTGNGYFNRSMRLWAKTKFKYTLNDHGLFIERTQDRAMEASEEVQVFDKLGLVYKEPHERDSFDALESKDGSVDTDLSESQFREDKTCAWVN